MHRQSVKLTTNTHASNFGSN